MPKQARLLAAFVGRIAPLGPNRVPSAFVKNCVYQQVLVNRLGLKDDAQADRAVHGGIDKAVYAYPSENYTLWHNEFPEHSSIWGLGSVGEKSRLGRIGRERGPYWRYLPPGVCRSSGDPTPQAMFQARLAIQRRPADRAAHGARRPYGLVFSGFGGRPLSDGQQLTLLERPHADWSIRRVNKAAYDRSTTEETLREIAALPELSAAWRDQTLALAGVSSAKQSSPKFRSSAGIASA